MTSLQNAQTEPLDKISPARLVTRPFVLVVACNMAIFTAIGVLTPVLPRLVTRQLGGNNADLGRMTLIYAAGAIGSRPLLSVISRRFGAKQNMMLGAIVAGLGFMLNYNVDSFGVLGLGRAISAIGEALSWVGFSTLISELAPEHRQAEATSISSTSIFGGLALGPLLGEPLAKSGRYNDAVLLIVALSVLALVLALFAPTSTAPKATWRMRWRDVFHPHALATGLTLGLCVVGWVAWSNLVALHADDLGMKSAGPIFTLYAVLALCLRVFGAKLPERIGLVHCAKIAAVFIAMGCAALFIDNTPRGIYVGTAILAAGIALMYPALAALTIARQPNPTQRAVLLGSFSLFFELGSGFGGAIIGPTADHFGRRSGFLVGAIVPLLALVTIRTLIVPGLRKATELR